METLEPRRRDHCVPEALVQGIIYTQISTLNGCLSKALSSCLQKVTDYLPRIFKLRRTRDIWSRGISDIPELGDRPEGLKQGCFELQSAARRAEGSHTACCVPRSLQSEEKMWRIKYLECYAFSNFFINLWSFFILCIP